MCIVQCIIIPIKRVQAPCSLNALVWGAMRRDGTSAALLLGTPDLNVADRLTHALFGMSTAVLWLTLLALWRRRAAIRKQVPFHDGARPEAYRGAH